MFTKDCPAIIMQCPTGRFTFVGRVPEGLSGKSFASADEAKIAAVDLMIETGATFPVDVVGNTRSAT